VDAHPGVVPRSPRLSSPRERAARRSVERVVRDHLQRGADDEADADHGDGDADQPLLLAAHHGGDEREDQGRRREAKRAVDELERAEEERGRSQQPGHDLDRATAVPLRRGHRSTVSRRAAARAWTPSRRPCGPPRRGRGPVGRFQGRHSEYSPGSWPGSGSALIAYHTTNPRYTIGILRINIKK